MDIKREAGILLHPSSFPGSDGIGDIGPEAFAWIDFLTETGCQLWQILPLGPTGYGDSPYQCFSAIAGNPYLISPAILLDEGLLQSSDLADRPAFPDGYVDFGPAIIWKNTLLDRAYVNFKRSRKKVFRAEFDQFIEENSGWLNDFSLFMAIKEAEGGQSWDHWEEGLRKRLPEALENFKQKQHNQVEKHMFQQYLFFKQWNQVRAYANGKGIRIIGDIPFVIAYDSADAWSNPDLFYLDENSRPTVVAGVPPDYFSRTGQLWGNPLYRWKNHKANGYAWWLERIKSVLKMVDIIRLDHFRGFEAYWEVPFGNPTAEIGRWVKGPGHDFFKAVKSQLGDLPIIAEDLGVITDGVIDIRDSFDLPGMKILQFAFASDADDAFLPHNYPVNCYAYTGTHDNNTARGWYDAASDREKDFCRRYLAVSGEDISWSMIRVLWQSVAAKVVAPLQDLLSLGIDARMNLPGAASGNWSWRFRAGDLNGFIKSRLYETNLLYGRLPEKMKEAIQAELELQSTGEVKPH